MLAVKLGPLNPPTTIASGPTANALRVPSVRGMARNASTGDVVGAGVVGCAEADALAGGLAWLLAEGTAYDPCADGDAASHAPSVAPTTSARTARENDRPFIVDHGSRSTCQRVGEGRGPCA
jgi:hypothetical protein